MISRTFDARKDGGEQSSVHTGVGVRTQEETRQVVRHLNMLKWPAHPRSDPLSVRATTTRMTAVADSVPVVVTALISLPRASASSHESKW